VRSKVAMTSEVWGEDIAHDYDTTSAAMFDPAVLGPTVDCLVELAQGGRVLEFAVGTGRVALALRAQGLRVSGIELSPHMAAQMKNKPGAESIEIAIGDMRNTRMAGAFSLVYLVWNSIMNVATQDGQVEVFQNAAGHLDVGGHFVVEVGVPKQDRSPVGELGKVFAMEDDHVGIDTFDDPVEQILTSHHWFEVNGHLVRHAGRFRFVWPSELDLMARIAGMRLVHRWAGWRKEIFTSESVDQIAVYQKIAQHERP
jgi:SAM-dependent methyltransferase